jgi:hypothetical protein
VLRESRVYIGGWWKNASKKCHQDKFLIFYVKREDDGKCQQHMTKFVLILLLVNNQKMPFLVLT